MKSIAILVCDSLLPQNGNDDLLYRECHGQIETLRLALETIDMTLSLVAWRKAAKVADQYDAMLPLCVWDYFEGNEVAFLEAAVEASRHTRLLNSFPTLEWNSNKRYLDDLATRGAEVIETVLVDQVKEAEVIAAAQTLGTDHVVIKPLVGGGAWRQVLHRVGDPFPNADQLPPSDAMVQAFLPSVVEEGEYSFLHFNGEFSHAIVKRPAQGDYRIQATYGGTEEVYEPTDQEKMAAAKILDYLPEMPLYARVDLLRGNDNRLKLIELELIEPFLFLSYAGSEGELNRGAKKFAEALRTQLG